MFFCLGVGDEVVRQERVCLVDTQLKGLTGCFAYRFCHRLQPLDMGDQFLVLISQGLGAYRYVLSPSSLSAIGG